MIETTQTQRMHLIFLKIIDESISKIREKVKLEKTVNLELFDTLSETGNNTNNLSCQMLHTVGLFTLYTAR